MFLGLIFLNRVKVCQTVPYITTVDNADTYRAGAPYN